MPITTHMNSDAYVITYQGIIVTLEEISCAKSMHDRFDFKQAIFARQHMCTAWMQEELLFMGISN